jgi:hypothetical protein
MAHTLPAQPAGGGVPAITRDGRLPPSFAATPAVPSELRSSTTITLSAPGYSWPSSAGSVTGSISASFLAGTTATTSGHAGGSVVTEGNHSLVRQYPPWPATRYAQATAAATQATPKTSIPAASHTTGPPVRNATGRKARDLPARSRRPIAPAQATRR